jgi:DNA-binding transcriptional MocR family regulator
MRRGWTPAVAARAVEHAVRHCRTVSAIRLLRYLARMHVRYHGVFPSQETIARALGMSVATVRRATAELEAAGLLEVTRHRAVPDVDHGGRWRRPTNRYRCRFREKRAAGAASHQVAPSAHERALQPPTGVPTRRRRAAHVEPGPSWERPAGPWTPPPADHPPDCRCDGTGWWYPDDRSLTRCG